MKLECEKNYYTNGALRKESWYFRDKNNFSRLHRENGPAVIIYAVNGSVMFEHYFLNDIRHRIDGPQYIEYHTDGYVVLEEYKFKGKKYSKENYYKLAEVIEYQKQKEFDEYIEDLINDD